MKSAVKNVSSIALAITMSAAPLTAAASPPGTLTESQAPPLITVTCLEDSGATRWSFTTQLTTYLGQLAIPVAPSLQGDDNEDVQMMVPGDVGAHLACEEPSTYNNLFGVDADLDFPLLFD